MFAIISKLNPQDEDITEQRWFEHVLARVFFQVQQRL